MSFWKSAGKAIAGSAGGIATGLIGGLFGIGANKRRAREAQKQRQWSESMWEKQNAYNTPKMQMERLRSAGLNPALMYGQGNTGNADKALPYSQPQVSNVGVEAAQAAAAGTSMDLVMKQKNLMDEDAKYKASQRFKTELEASQIIPEFKLKKDLTMNMIDNYQATIRKVDQDILESISRIGTNEASIALKNAQVELTNAQKVAATAQANRFNAATDLDKEVLKEYEQGYSRNLQKTIGQFFNVPDVKKASFTDKAAMLISLSPFLPGGTAAAKGISSFAKAATNYIKKLLK
jgi:hypothetical protein